MGRKTFVFDCGGVLLRNDTQDPVYAAWETRLGLPEGSLKARLWSGEIWEQAEIGQISEEQYWQRSGAALGIDDPALIAELAEALWASWTLDTRVLAMVDRIRERHPLAMLSNATTALEERLERQFGIADRFATIVNSARVGLAKPDPAIYQALLEQLAVPARDTVFIDDRAENIAAAAAKGMHVIWYVGADELERQLKVYLNGHAAGDEDDHNGNGHKGNGHEPLDDPDSDD